MRSTRLFSLAFLLLAACGGGDDTGDAVTPDAEVVEIDAEPPPPDAPACDMLMCGDLCVDEQNDEQHCGDCTTVCEQTGSVCEVGNCGCPPDFVIASPTFLGDGIDNTSVPGVVLGFGGYPNVGKLHVLVAGYATGATVVGVAYPLDGDLVPPFFGAGYDVDINTQEAQAAFFATAGTITFTTICDVGFSGHADDVTFTAVESLDNPTPDPEGCTFTEEVVNFEFGDPCP